VPATTDCSIACHALISAALCAVLDQTATGPAFSATIHQPDPLTQGEW
jgi:hypothetical protein